MTIRPLLIAVGIVVPTVILNVQTYNRADWPHWSDFDGDCQDTRQEVLVDEGNVIKLRPDGCRVLAGVWHDPYTGLEILDPRQLDVDHMVPLSWAHDHGAADWTREQKRQYANSQTDPDHLVAVRARENRQKGAKGPDEWVPPNAAALCWYGLAWSRIVTEWNLILVNEEADAIVRLVATCDAAGWGLTRIESLSGA